MRMPFVAKGREVYKKKAGCEFNNTKYEEIAFLILIILPL